MLALRHGHFNFASYPSNITSNLHWSRIYGISMPLRVCVRQPAMGMCGLAGYRVSESYLAAFFRLCPIPVWYKNNGQFPFDAREPFYRRRICPTARFDNVRKCRRRHACRNSYVETCRHSSEWQRCCRTVGEILTWTDFYTLCKIQR
jgi:hypothetical protein